WNHKDSYRVLNVIVSTSTIEHPSLGLVFFPAFYWKISDTHQERQERLLYTRDQIVEEGLLDVPNIREYHPIVADWDVIERVHVGAPDLASWVTDAHRVS
ncbi:histone deacetylase, partial [Veillonella atypica]|nr:histone deacetylase [Veillonella atypica]